ncbi:MAG: AAA family ATPase [Clostridia bacterium]|nr:AAA family ATPase [Clostridia bacterium]
MSDIKLNDVVNMNVDAFVEKLGGAYSTIINKGLPVKSFPSVMLWGAPGVGKSQGVRQIATKIEEETGKKVFVTDVRLLLFNPIDLRGIPTANQDKTLAVWLKPQIFQMNESKDVVNILFLDEISSAPQSVQASAYQITLDRVVGEHKLPENCIVIGAGNRLTDKSVAYKMPKALANRLLHINVEGSFASWNKWAVKSGINAKVLGFLSFQKDSLFKGSENSEDLAFPTPRSWEMVSNVLNSVSDDVKEVFPFIAGLVGVGMASEFRTWCKIYANLPKIEDIFAGKRPPVPRDTDALYALVSAMVSHAREVRNDLGKIANSIDYANLIPADFSVILMKDYAYLEKDYQKKLMAIPEYMRWLQTRGKLLNGNN